MKCANLFFGTFLCLMLTVACSEKRIVPAEQLPVGAKIYVEQSYPGRSITYVKKDSEFFSTKYEVGLDDGTEIEFNKDGEPVDIDMED